MKAILEMEMPEHCAACKLSVSTGEWLTCSVVSSTRRVNHPYVRDEYCPLKIVRDAEEPKPLGLPAMTLRDYFAGQALNGILANPKKFPTGIYANGKAIAQKAYYCADEMLAAREAAAHES